MSPEAQVSSVPLAEVSEWQPPMPPTDLVLDDGEPLESNRHRIAMNLLIRSLKHHWADRSDYFVGGNMFIYYSSQQVKNKDLKEPDFLAVQKIKFVVKQNLGKTTFTIFERCDLRPLH